MTRVRSTRVKICGITRVEDAVVAEAAGADAIGLVFYPPSPRYVADLALARDIALAAGPFVNVVGLFVDPDAEELARVLHQVPISLLQFHGREDDNFCRQFDRPYIKALRMKPGVDVLAQANTYAGASGILLDAYSKGVPGGTGETFDWQRVPKQLPKPLILAGGLESVNVGSAISAVRPWAVDVSGGVESAKGLKDARRVHEFCEAAASVSD